MKVELTITEKKKVEVEVIFPIYRQHDVGSDSGSSVIYTRITEDGRFFSIQKSVHYDRGTSYEIEFGPHYFDASGEDYSLGRGRYASTKAEFDGMVAETTKVLTGLA
jgi:hypothetical protein